MKQEIIRENALGITNGTKFELKYRSDAKVLNKRNYLKKQGVSKEELPKMKEGGSNPSKKAYKHTIYTLVYDERGYFRQCTEEGGLILYPDTEKKNDGSTGFKESGYEKIRGMLYNKKEDDSGDEYVRFAIRKDRIKIGVEYTTDKAGKSVVDYEEIEPYLQESAKKGYESYNRQTSTGLQEIEILQLGFKLENIVSLKIVKE